MNERPVVAVDTISVYYPIFVLCIDKIKQWIINEIKNYIPYINREVSVRSERKYQPICLKSLKQKSWKFSKLVRYASGTSGWEIRPCRGGRGWEESGLESVRTGSTQSGNVQLKNCPKRHLKLKVRFHRSPYLFIFFMEKQLSKY